MNAWAYFWVFLGGGLGSICRFSLGKWLPVANHLFPWPTFWANLISSFILGFLVGQKLQGQLSLQAQFLLMTGFCGGFSTFSTFSYEALALLEDGEWTMAFLYVGGSLLVGLLAVFAGLRLSYFLA